MYPFSKQYIFCKTGFPLTYAAEEMYVSRIMVERWNSGFFSALALSLLRMRASSVKALPYLKWLWMCNMHWYYIGKETEIDHAITTCMLILFKKKKNLEDSLSSELYLLLLFCAIQSWPKLDIFQFAVLFMANRYVWVQSIDKFWTLMLK